MRVVGRVTSSGKGLGGVPVTDGETVVQTDVDGRFAFTSSTRRPFVYLSVPAGYQLPQHETGTARFYRPIEPGDGDTAEATFNLRPLDRDDEQHAFVVLADPQTGIKAEVQQFLNEAVPDVRRTVRASGDRPVFGVGCGDLVFAHIPPLSTAYRRQGVSSPPVGGMIINRQALYDALAPYNAHIITGHTHENEHRFAAGPHEHVVGTVCGAWWTGPICHDGTPKGYAVYEVSGETVQWRYKSTGHDVDHQMRLYPASSDPEAPDEFIANVWDADPEWTIVWYEDGVKAGRMARRVGIDPLSKALYAGDDRPKKNSWVDPRPTGHLFYAPFNPNANQIQVEATDRFGNTYAATLDSAGNASSASPN